MLPKAPLLRPLVPEHRGVVVELDRKPLVPQVMRDDRAHHGGRPLGPQGERVIASVHERVHLLVHDVGGLTDAALEQVGVFEHRRDRAAVAGALEDVCTKLLEGPEPFGSGRQEILRAPGLFHRPRRRGSSPRASAITNGLVRRSTPTAVSGPCPLKITTSSSIGSTTRRIESIRSSSEPPGKSERPIEPWKMRSPENRMPSVMKTQWPGVWPGVCRTVRFTPPRRSSSLSDRSRTSAGIPTSNLPSSKRPPAGPGASGM